MRLFPGSPRISKSTNAQVPHIKWRDKVCPPYSDAELTDMGGQQYRQDVVLSTATQFILKYEDIIESKRNPVTYAVVLKKHHHKVDSIIIKAMNFTYETACATQG